MKKNILLLGGSSEGFELANRLNNHPTFHVISSLAGRTSLPRKPKGAFRTGGFGGIKGLSTYLQDNNIHALIDATHPYAQIISQNAAAAAKATNTPHIHLCRPAWQKTKTDHWIETNNATDSAKLLTFEQSPIFLTIGRTDLTAFLTRPELTFLTRAIEHPPEQETLPSNFKFIYAKGPFSYDDEVQLMQQHGIKALVSKNSGGKHAYAKIKVARTLQIPVIMIKRPTKPNSPSAETTEQIINWLDQIRTKS